MATADGTDGMDKFHLWMPYFGFNPCSVLNILARNEGSAIFRYLCHQLTFAKVLTSIRKCFHIATATWIPNFPNYLSRPCDKTTKKKYFLLNVFNYEVLDKCCKYNYAKDLWTNYSSFLWSCMVWKRYFTMALINRTQ